MEITLFRVKFPLRRMLHCFFLPWVKFVVSWLFVLPWQLWATANKEAHRNSVQHDLDHKITAFQSKIRDGSYYICSVCNRILHRKTVIRLKKQMYNTQHELFIDIPMIPFRLGMTYHLSPDDNLFWNRCMPLARLWAHYFSILVRHPKYHYTWSQGSSPIRISQLPCSQGLVS